MRSLGLDVGEARIGVAISDEEGMIATPFTVIESRGWDKDIIKIAGLARELDVMEIVVGMPRNMDGTYGPAATKVHEFCQRLGQAVEVPVVVQDERLTTVEATRVLLAADMSRKRRRQVIDKTAAALILQTHLDVKRAGAK